MANRMRWDDGSLLRDYRLQILRLSAATFKRASIQADDPLRRLKERPSAQLPKISLLSEH